MSAFKQYSVKLFFAGGLQHRSFRVYAIDAQNAINVATYDASALGYKVALITGYEVEIL